MGGEVEEPQKDPKVEEKVEVLVAPNEYVGPQPDICVFGWLLGVAIWFVALGIHFKGYTMCALVLIGLFFAARRWFWNTKFWGRWEMVDEANYLYLKLDQWSHCCINAFVFSDEEVCRAFNEAAHQWKTQNAGHLPTRTAAFLIRWNKHKKVFLPVPAQRMSLQTLVLNGVAWFGASMQKLAVATCPEMNPLARVENAVCNGCARNGTHVCKAVPITPVARAVPAADVWEAKAMELGFVPKQNRFQQALQKYKLALENGPDYQAEVDRVVKVALDFFHGMTGGILPVEVPDQVLKDGFLLVETNMKHENCSVTLHAALLPYFSKIEFVEQSDKYFYKFQ